MTFDLLVQTIARAARGKTTSQGIAIAFAPKEVLKDAKSDRQLAWQNAGNSDTSQTNPPTESQPNITKTKIPLRVNLLSLPVQPELNDNVKNCRTHFTFVESKSTASFTRSTGGVEHELYSVNNVAATF